MVQNPSMVPLVYADLRREEAVSQISANLESLNALFNGISDRLSSAINDNQSRINNIYKRIDLVNLKIGKIKGTNKAIQIFSGAKFPTTKEEAVENHLIKEPLFEDFHVKDPRRTHNHYTSQFSPFDDIAFKDRQSFQSYRRANNRAKQIDSEVKGLGSLLKDDVKSVTNLLLFNTAQHV